MKGQGLALTELKVYDILGNEVATLVNEPKEPGYYEVEFNASAIMQAEFIFTDYRLVHLFSRKRC